jgi:hypothetical protein
MTALQPKRLEPLDPDQYDGVYLPEAEQDRLSRKRSQRELARARVTATIASGLCGAVSLVAVVAMLGWRDAEQQLASNVKIAWVKLEPNGPPQIEIDPSNGDQNRWYEAGINGALINYTEHRFRKRRQTIAVDYGFALQFLDDAARSDFLDHYNAAKIAADFEHCGSCDEEEVEVRAIDHDQLISPARAGNRTSVVESTVYLTIHPLGAATKAADRLRFVKILWQLKPVAALTKDFAALKANPLGIEILEQHEFDDLAK